MRLRQRRDKPEPAAGESGTDLLTIVRELLEGQQTPVVAIVDVAEEGADTGEAGVLTRELPTARISTYDASVGLDELHVLLAAGGPFDLLLDLSSGKGSRRRFESLIFHARAGGTLVTRLSEGDRRAPDDGLPGHLRSLETARREEHLEEPTPGKDERTGKQRDRDALALSIQVLEITDEFAVVTNSVPTLAKIPEAAMNGFLRLRSSGDRVVDTVPAREWAVRCSVRASSDTYAATLPDTYQAPELSLREYRDVTCMPRQVAYKEGFVLPESFRHNARKRLRNPKFAEWAPHFVRDPLAQAVPVEGPLFYLDNHVRGHFGHTMTEQVSHLWGWRQAKEREPALRALVFLWGNKPMGEWEFELFAAAGIERDDVVAVDHPLQVDRLITTSPMFSMPEFVHPDIQTTYDELGAALAARAGTRTWPDRVFCSRRIQKRWCHNTAEVEQLFADAGFEVIYPEDHPMADQAQFFRRARSIAGFAGSGMFQLSLAGGPKRVLLISSEGYTAQNEYMMSAVLGHRLDIALCRPDVPREQGRFSVAWYQSDFTFDPDREGVFVRDWLEDL